jgi:branched-chain amino acid transport system ATP-binding protein
VPDTALEVDGLHAGYGPVTVVRDLSFRVGPGEVVGLVGPNGAGKSTTLLAIMGVVAARRGEVRLGGRPLRARAPEQVVRRGIALVPEGRHIFGGLTVEENLRLGLVGRRSGDGVEADRAWVEELFPIVREAAARSAGGLSGGQQQQLAIARALLARPDVLLLDEPSLGLAPSVVETVFGALTEIRRRGVSIVVVEQRAQLAVAFADRTHVISNGTLKLTLTPADAGDTGRMMAAYFGS